MTPTNAPTSTPRLTNPNGSMQIKIDQEIVGGDAVWAKCEVMCRNSPTPNADDPFVAQMYTKPGGADWLIDQFRTAADGPADWYHPNPQFTYSAPLWIDLLRNGEVFSFYYSENGTVWTDAIDINTSTNAFTGNDNGTSFGGAAAFGSTVTAGIAVTAHNNAETTTATISGLTVYFVRSISDIGASVPLQNCTNYAGCEASFSFQSTNNGSPPQTCAAATLYQWYKNGKAVAGATGTDFTFPIDPGDPTANGAKVYCQVTIAPPYNGTVKGMYSTTNTLTVLPGVTSYANALKLEYGPTQPSPNLRATASDCPHGAPSNSLLTIPPWVRSTTRPATAAGSSRLQRTNMCSSSPAAISRTSS